MKSTGPTSRSLCTHSVGSAEIPARVGDECTIGGMVDGLNRRDPLDELGVWRWMCLINSVFALAGPVTSIALAVPIALITS